jgi:hypothetical protein
MAGWKLSVVQSLRRPEDEALFTGTLSFTVPLDYRDPSNPFVHIYHPDHDNKDERFTPTLLPAGRESPNINRTITLTFTATNPAGFDPTWAYASG